MAAGHFSQTGIFDHARDEAFHFAFIIWALAACPDGLGGETDSVVVFQIVFAIAGAAVLLALAGEPQIIRSFLLMPLHRFASLTSCARNTVRDREVA